ncbi:hypothetical protein BH11PLA1_BH11PLA1_08820 [soil metagenome]
MDETREMKNVEFEKWDWNLLGSDRTSNVASLNFNQLHLRKD